MRGARGRFRTRANAVTLVRLAAAPALAWAVARDAPLAASLVFALAAASDFADGRLARRFGEASPFGGLLDHAVDAVFVGVGSAALAAAGVLPALLPPLIAVAFLQYALDSRVFAARGLRASSLGRVNGIAYYVIVAVPIVRDALGWSWPGAALVRALAWTVVASTLLSIGDRLRALARAE